MFFSRIRRCLAGLLTLLATAAHATSPLTTVSGHIEHPSGHRVALFVGKHPLTGRPLSSVWAELDARGDFRLELPDLPYSQQVTFVHGAETARLFLTPGDALQLTLDAAQFDETLRFTGAGAPANNYLVQYFLRFEDVPLRPPTPAAQPAHPETWQTPAQNQHRLDSLWQERRQFYRRYAAAQPLPADFCAFMRRYDAHVRAAQRLWYPYLRRYIEQQPTLPAPAGFYGFLRQQPALDSARLQSSAAYDELLGSYLSATLRLAPQPLAAPEVAALLAEHFGPGATRSIVLARYCQEYLGSHGAEAAAPLLAELQRQAPDTLLLGPVQRSYQRKLALSQNRPAPAFTVHDATGREVSLSDFRGKVVYLDFWASWCAPCLLEMPASAALRQKFAGQDVVFLYVSVDTKETAWRQALTQLGPAGPAGVHGWAPGFGAAAPTAYRVESIPAYFLIDRQGRLQGATAPRPRETEAVTAAIEQALRR